MRKRRLIFLYICLLALFGAAEGKQSQPVDAPIELLEDEKYIALTFDDGPRRGTTDCLLDGLRERGASATFFLVGEEIAANQDLVKRMRAEGHQVGNHTWSHVRLADAAPDKVAEEVGKTEATLENLLGESGYWLRPPYGFITKGTEKQINVPMVKWSVDPRDWESRDTEKVVKAVLQDAKPNSIVLLHDIYPTSVEAALQIVDALQKEGYWFVTVEELLALNGITPQAGTMYRTGNP